MSSRIWSRSRLYRFLHVLTGPGQRIQVIVLYHSIGQDPPYGTPANRFEQQMQYLKEHFRVVRLCDLAREMNSRTGATNLACVTFDDGCRDNYETALPILERVGIKATFFITTGFVGSSFHSVQGQVPAMTRDQICQLVARGHEVGAHTVSHAKLTRITLEEVRAEIQRSKEFLEDLLTREIVSFAYPRGDWNGEVRREVGISGFSSAVTVREGLVPQSADWLALPRVWTARVRELNAFAAHVSPAVEWGVRLLKFLGMAK